MYSPAIGVPPDFAKLAMVGVSVAVGATGDGRSEQAASPMASAATAVILLMSLQGEEVAPG